VRVRGEGAAKVLVSILLAIREKQIRFRKKYLRGIL